MNKYTKYLTFIAIILVSVSIAYFVGRSYGVKEYFTNTEQKKTNYRKTMGNATYKLKPKNVSIFMKMTKDEAGKYGISHETYNAMQDLFKNNGSPEDFANILKNDPKQGTAIQNMVLSNSV